MKKIIDNELIIKVFLYDTEQDRDEHIATMKKDGYGVQRSGVANTHPDSTVTAFMNEDNWKPYAEFSKEKKNVEIKEPISYETDLYFFNVYNPIKEK